MLHRCLLLSCLTQSAFAVGLREVNVADDRSSFLQTRATKKTAVEELRERALKLQEELSKLPSDGLGVKEAEEAAFRVPSPPSQKLPSTPSQKHLNVKQKALLEEATATHIAATHTASDAAVFTKLAAKAKDLALADPEVTKTSKSLVLKPGAMAPEEDAMDEDADEEGGGGADSHPTTRPNEGGKPEVITFGLFAKTFYGINLKANNFVIDVVMTLKWTDERVKSLIPAGMDSLTLSKKESEKKIWLPGMVITNRDIKKYDLISTAVFINKKGEVFKVERSTAIVKNKYVLNDFPFDRQNLVVKIASHKYMIGDLMLKPAARGSGAKEGLLEGESYDFVSARPSAFKDVDGALKKSRGLLTMVVDRALDKYTQSHIVPSFLVVMISWAVFWFPFVAPFITPRLAMSVLSLLTFTNLSLKSADCLPPGAPFNWNDVINRTIMTLMFFTVCLSMLSEVCMHQLKIEDVAKAVNYECKLLMPLLSISSLALILSASGRHGWMSLDTTSTVVQVWMILIVGSYCAFNASRMVAAQRKKAEAAEPLLKK